MTVLSTAVDITEGVKYLTYYLIKKWYSNFKIIFDSILYLKLYNWPSLLISRIFHVLEISNSIIMLFTFDKFALPFPSRFLNWLWQKILLISNKTNNSYISKHINSISDLSNLHISSKRSIIMSNWPFITMVYTKMLLFLEIYIH